MVKSTELENSLAEATKSLTEATVELEQAQQATKEKEAALEIKKVVKNEVRHCLAPLFVCRILFFFRLLTITWIHT